jgi:hypothetical protein
MIPAPFEPAITRWPEWLGEDTENPREWVSELFPSSARLRRFFLRPSRSDKRDERVSQSPADGGLATD